MNKLILGAAIFSISMLANAGSAGVSVGVTKSDAATAEEVNITADKSEAGVAKTDCITDTGSRIKRAKDKKGCNGEPGRSFDRDDIDRTGALTTGEALERLDPSIRISH
ncbi:MAG: hypothetical protein ABI644_05610 [Arenimonas sp.]